MTPRRIGLAVLVLTAAFASWYFFLYLTRWEWNRAIISGVIFIAAEIALLGTLVLGRIARLHDDVRDLKDRPAEPRAEIVERVRDADSGPRDPFAWLSPKDGRTSVFIPVLLGAGVIVSALAWVVERLARWTTNPRRERALAFDLEAIALPDEPLYEPASRSLGLFGPRHET